MCVCVYHCAQLSYNTVQNCSDNGPCCPLDSRHSSDVVCWRRWELYSYKHSNENLNQQKNNYGVWSSVHAFEVMTLQQDRNACIIIIVILWPWMLVGWQEGYPKALCHYCLEVLFRKRWRRKNEGWTGWAGFTWKVFVKQSVCVYDLEYLCNIILSQNRKTRRKFDMKFMWTVYMNIS